MNTAYVSSLVAGSYFEFLPDTPDGSGIPTLNNFVLCRDSDGIPTAIYGEDCWDFNPYRLSERKIRHLDFAKVFNGADTSQKKLVLELKYILFCIIYSVSTGRIGRLSAATLGMYFIELRLAARFCYEQKSKPLVGALTMQQLLTTPAYLSAFVSKNNSRIHFNKRFKAILNNLATVGEQRLGYKALLPDTLDFGRVHNNQHPVIPTRIYLELINTFGGLIDKLKSVANNLESFIGRFADEFYGRSQNKQANLGVAKRDWRATFEEGAENYNLSSIFTGAFACVDRRQFTKVLLDMQYIVRMTIHLYTGMREQEVMRLKYNCVMGEVAVPESVDNRGLVCDPAKMVSIISATTKFEGYRKDASWLATEEVIGAVAVARAICRGLAILYKYKDSSECGLFINPSILIHDDADVVSSASYKSVNRIRWSESLNIRLEDLSELSHTDPSRNFSGDKRFLVGQRWPLTSHQFRRSLAFYGSSSGFISLPSLRAQYKHAVLAMARYYANGFQNLKTIFGYFDKEKNDFILPSGHFAYEFQMGIPIATVSNIMMDVFQQGVPLFGGTGSYMEKQKFRVERGDIGIQDVRAETMQRVRNGEISYRSTLLGGCTKVGRCDSFLLGDFAACLSCEGAIIKSENVSEVICLTKMELERYVEGSGEYQITKEDLVKLEGFKSHFIDGVRG